MKINENKLGYLQGWLSIAVNILLFILKYWVGILTGSIALIADAWHTLSDSISSIILIVGIKLSCKPPDKKHPYGHGRIELITSLLIAALLGIIAFNFFWESVQRLLNQEQVVYGFWAIIVTVLSILLKEALAQFAFYAGKKTGRRSVKADGWHHRSDAISSLIILIGIFVSEYFWWIDGVLGIFVAILIGYTAYDIMKENMSIIIGEAPNDDFIDKIISLANNTAEQELKIHDLHIHNYIMYKELTFHIKLPKNMDIFTANTIVEKIENKIKDTHNIRTTIKIEPDY